MNKQELKVSVEITEGPGVTYTREQIVSFAQDLINGALESRGLSGTVEVTVR